MWKPVDTEFFCRRRPVEVVAAGDAGSEPQFVRALLEELGAVVQMHLIGTPADFLKVLGQGPGAAPYLVICAHGDDNGFRLGEYAEGIDTSMLAGGILPFGCIAEIVDLPGVVVVNTACSGGEPAAAEAFMKGGVRAYVGNTAPDPHASAWPVFLAQFFYELFHRGLTELEAWRRAASYDDETRLFVFYDERGPHHAP
jgi:hypothetical protein